MEEAERVHELKVTERKHARQGWTKVRSVVHFASHVWVDEDDPKHSQDGSECKRQEDEELLGAFGMGGNDEGGDDGLDDLPEVLTLEKLASRQSTHDGCEEGSVPPGSGRSHTESTGLSEPDGHSDGNVHQSHSLE